MSDFRRETNGTRQQEFLKTSLKSAQLSGAVLQEWVEMLKKKKNISGFLKTKLNHKVFDFLVLVCLFDTQNCSWTNSQQWEKKHTFCCKNDEKFEKHLGLEKDAAPLLSRWLSSAQHRSTAQKKIRVAAAQGFKIFQDSWVEMDQNGAKAPMITSFRMSHGKSMFNHGLRQPHFTSTWPVYLWHNCFPPLKLAGSMRLPF